MAKAQLDASIEVIGELATLNAVVRAFQLDAVVSRMGDVQAKEPPEVTRHRDATVTNHLVVQLIGEVEDRLLTIIATNDDRLFCRATFLDANSIFAVALLLGIVCAATTDDMGTGSCGIDGLLQVVPRTFYCAVAIGVAIGGDINFLRGCGERLGGNPSALGDIGRVINSWFDGG